MMQEISFQDDFLEKQTGFQQLDAGGITDFAGFDWEYGTGTDAGVFGNQKISAEDYGGFGALQAG